MGIMKYETTAYTPKANGVVKRFNKILCETLAKLVHHQQCKWDVVLPVVIFEYNTSVHATTGNLPHMLMFGSSPSIPLEIIHNREHTPKEWNDTQLPDKTEYLKQAAQRIQATHERNAMKYNNKQRPHHFKVGDKVIFLKTLHSRKNIFHKKLALLGEEPFKIININFKGS